ncbi:MAG: c-type cytochrome [Dehalococcoidia bacterium]
MNHASEIHFPHRRHFMRGLLVALLGGALVLGAACDDPNDTGGGGGNGTSTPTASASATGAGGTGGTGSGEPQGGGATGTATGTVEANYGLSPGGSPTPAATAAAAGGSAVERALAANIGQDAPQSLVDEWDIDITPDGTGLPDGAGSVPDGADVYAQGCARCHGSDGTGSDLAPRLVLGDQGQPGPWEYGAPRTVANYWPYLTTYMDFIRRAMPFDQPNTLTDDQLYAVTAWILNQNGMLPDDATLDRDSVMDMNELPNLDSFFSCYPQGCRPEPELRGAQQGGGN